MPERQARKPADMKAKGAGARSRVGALLAWLCLTSALAQPGVPPGPPAARAQPFDPAPILALAQGYLAELKPMAIYERVHGPRRDKREVVALLGDGERVYARFNLDPQALEPIAIGLEGLAPPLPEGARPQAMLRALEPLTPEALAFSSVVVPEPKGYKLLLVFEGRIVGELRLNGDLEPRAEEKWLEEYERSAWRYPETLRTSQEP